MKLLLYKVLPLGAAAGLLFSNASPLKATLHTFESAGNALGGDDAVNTGDVAFPDEASVNSAIGGDWADRGGGGGGGSGGGFSLGKMVNKLFGSSNHERTQAQLASIINSVKAKAPAGGAANPKAGGKGAPAGKAGGKGVPGKAPAKAASTTPQAMPAAAGAPQ